MKNGSHGFNLPFYYIKWNKEFFHVYGSFAAFVSTDVSYVLCLFTAGGVLPT